MLEQLHDLIAYLDTWDVWSMLVLKWLKSQEGGVELAS